MDLRHYERHEWVPLLELTLSSLAPGDTLEAIFPGWPEVFVQHLQRRYAGEFSWRAGDENDEWCALVIRRTSASGMPTVPGE